MAHPKEPKVEVPRAALEEVATLSWSDLLTLAKSAGWRVQTTDSWKWCATDHALLREGDGRMRGVPVLHYQAW